MSDMNANTRILNGVRVPSEVVNKKTGERLLRAPVDAKEMIASGLWEWAPVETPPVASGPVTTTDKSGTPFQLETVVLPPDTESMVPVVEALEKKSAKKDDAAEEPYKPLWTKKAK